MASACLAIPPGLKKFIRKYIYSPSTANETFYTKTKLRLIEKTFFFCYILLLLRYEMVLELH